ncbi:MAG: HAD family hydrolase [Pelolinea sp.]|nr:HAD family hydrolase [Pelolinea sp.]
MWPDINIDQFKLFVFDVDGTILQLHHEIDPFTRSVLLDLKNNEFLVTLATGKNLKSTRKLAEILQIDLPLVLSNGCVLQSLDGVIHQKYFLPIDFLRQLIEVCERMDLDLAIHIEEDIFVKNINENISILFSYGSPSLEEVGDWESIEYLLPKAYKCLVVDRKNRERLFQLEDSMRALVGDSVNYCQTLPEMVEFMPPGVSKLTGIKTIAIEKNISMNSIMAFGDGNNDAEMLGEVGYGVAVENASNLAKNSADWVVPSCAENGPAQFLNHLINKKN